MKLSALNLVEKWQEKRGTCGAATLLDLWRALEALISDPEPECTCGYWPVEPRPSIGIDPDCPIHGVAKSPTTGADKGTPKSTDPGHAQPSDGTLMVFGDLIWEWITEDTDRFFSCEYSEDLMELAQKCQMVERVKYDPEIHGEMGEAEPGDLIWYWGERGSHVSKGDKPFHGTFQALAASLDVELWKAMSIARYARLHPGHPDRSAQPGEGGDLRPCPWCGEVPNVFQVPDPRYGEDAKGWVIECKSIGCMFGRSRPNQSRQDLIETWNTRVSPPQGETVTGIHTMVTAILAEVQEAARMRKFVMGHPSLYRGESQGLTAEEKLLVLRALEIHNDLNQVIDRLKEADDADRD